jgi:hypothetical protein
MFSNGVLCIPSFWTVPLGIQEDLSKRFCMYFLSQVSTCSEDHQVESMVIMNFVATISWKLKVHSLTEALKELG